MSSKQWLLLIGGIYSVVGMCLYFFASSTIVSIFFRLLNFLVLIGILAIVYRRTLGPKLWYLIHKQEEKQETLVVRYDDLVREQDVLAEKLEEQDQQCRYLLGKIDIWSNAFEEHQKQFRQARQKAHKEAEKKALQQAQWLVHKHLYKEVVDKTVDQMYVHLKEYFEKAENQQHFMKELLVFMKKSVS